MPHPLIQYRGYYNGPRDIGGMTALYDTREEALRVAKAICSRNSHTWINPVYIGPLDAVLLAVEPLEYIDWRGQPQRKRIEVGEEFRPGDIMAADHQITPDQIGIWIVEGKVESLPVAQMQEAEIKGGDEKEVVERSE